MQRRTPTDLNRLPDPQPGRLEPESSFQLASPIQRIDSGRSLPERKPAGKRAGRENGTDGMEIFSYVAPAATGVLLLGDFTDWQERPIPLRRESNTLWRVAVRLKPGRHHYRFIVGYSGGQSAVVEAEDRGRPVLLAIAMLGSGRVQFVAEVKQGGGKGQGGGTGSPWTPEGKASICSRDSTKGSGSRDRQGKPGGVDSAVRLVSGGVRMPQFGLPKTLPEELRLLGKFQQMKRKSILCPAKATGCRRQPRAITHPIPRVIATQSSWMPSRAGGIFTDFATDLF